MATAECWWLPFTGRPSTAGSWPSTKTSRSSRSSSGSARGAAQGVGEKRHRCERKKPPCRKAHRDEQGRGAERGRDSDRHAPVVADDEGPPEVSKAREQPHVRASAGTVVLRALRIRTSANAESATKASTPRSAS